MVHTRMLVLIAEMQEGGVETLTVQDDGLPGGGGSKCIQVSRADRHTTAGY